MHPVATVHPWDAGPLRVTDNRRYLANGGEPFFWLGDTAWLLFQNLSLEEAKLYLRNRRDKGFTVIQATLIHTLPGVEHNSLPVNLNDVRCALLERDFARPDVEGGFWHHVDDVVEAARELGLYMALLPSWGSMVTQGLLNEGNAQAYATFLARRYGQCPSVLWLLGGDVRVEEHTRPIFDLLGNTLKELAPTQLIGYHPFGRTASSMWLCDAPWLDFHMFQSGHRRYDQDRLSAWDDNAEDEECFSEDNWMYVQRDHRVDPGRPTVDGEPSYEQIPQGLHDSSQPYWQDHDVRRYAWWAVLEGAMGHTYGDNAVMQFHIPGDSGGNYGVKVYWHEAIHHPGSGQMGHMAALLRALDFTNGAPARHILTSPQPKEYGRISAFAGRDYAILYSYVGQPFSVDLSSMGWSRMDAWWFDPAIGVYSYAGQYDAKAQTFIPPVKPSGQNDWVLLCKSI